ncbi:hypothetical protein F5Y01DRAFT_319726 [Xylaria sp. FL0043]|nr:hypothetical protein F5Y01DRAFT_319726 [Xylaria sp. FL0043]
MASLSCWDELRASLDAVTRSSSVPCVMRYPGAPNPGLQIKDNLIPLPLTKNTAELIKNLSHQASSGNEARISTENQAHRALEFGIDQFELLNPAWPSFIDTILKDVCSKLHITVSVDAKLHKLKFVEKGSSYTSLFNSWNEERKIAELLICLPSDHKRGEVRDLATLGAQEVSLFDTEATAYLSDTVCEMKEAVSSHRLVLVYNIFQRRGPENFVNGFGRPLNALDSALRRCRQQDPDFSPRLYLLDNIYTTKKLSLDQLVTRDRAVGKSLSKLRSRHGLYILLGCRQEGLHLLYRAWTEFFPFTANIHEPNGNWIAFGQRLLEDQFLNLSSEDGRGVIIICPKVRLLSFLKPSERTSWSNIATMVCDDLDSGPDVIGFSGDALRVLDDISSGSDVALWRVNLMQWAWQRNYLNLYNKLFVSLADQRACNAMQTVAQIINEDTSEEADAMKIRWEKYFSVNIHRITSLDAFFSSLSLIKSAMRADLHSSFRMWRRDFRNATLEKKATLGVQDQYLISQLIMLYGYKSHPSTKMIIDALRARGEKALIRNLIVELLSSNEKEKSTNAKDIAAQILLGTDWKAALDPKDLEGDRFRVAIGYISFLRCILKTDAENLGVKLLDASWEAIAAQHTSLNDAPLIHYRCNVKHFLRKLAHELEEYEVPYLHSMRELFKLFIRRYMHFAVPLFPKQRLEQTNEEFEQEMTAYKKGFLEFENDFKMLRGRYITQLLETDYYNELVMLDGIKASHDSLDFSAAVLNTGLKRSASRVLVRSDLYKKTRTRFNSSP